MNELKRTKTGGRTKGAQNKITKEIKEVFKEIIECNLSQLEADILELSPKERIDVILKISEFVLPKLQRVSGDTFNKIDNEIVVIRGNKWGEPIDNNIDIVIEGIKRGEKIEYEDEYV